VISDFQTTLQSITFKTFHQNQLTTLGFDDLFKNKRVVVFSTTRMGPTSNQYLGKFHLARSELAIRNIDATYAINSTEWIIGPWVDKLHHSLIGLPDRDCKFVEALAKHCNLTKPVEDAAKHWEYILIIKNGDIEKIWKNLSFAYL
jgi:peroxiredoxin